MSTRLTPPLLCYRLIHMLNVGALQGVDAKYHTRERAVGGGGVRDPVALRITPY